MNSRERLYSLAANQAGVRATSSSTAAGATRRERCEVLELTGARDTVPPATHLKNGVETGFYS